MPGAVDSWIKDHRLDGQVAAQGDEYAVAVLSEEEDDYCILYDTFDGHPLRVPEQDKRYQLAKVRPTPPGDRARWVKIQGRKGMVHYAEGGSVPAYSETPPAVLPDRSQPVAQVGGVKTGSRRRKRGKRGRGKVLA